MTMHVTVPAARAVHAVPAPARKAKERPRALILNQVIAGILWMSLDLPEDVSRQELEEFAHCLVARINAGTAEEFCLRTDAATLRGLIRRAANIVQGS
jgi:hypothetical protein